MSASMSPLDAILRLAQPGDIEAIKSIVVTRGPRKGRVLRQRPKDKRAAIAWTAFRTACGWHGEGDTAFLIMFARSDEDRALWDRLTDVFVAARKQWLANERERYAAAERVANGSAA